ncbi:thioredoxin domain-containing protein [Bacteroides sp.]|uniref:DsbA family protein n=1 Tax=Bacteroides sp. TaxID=29523 RepID=UPI002FC7ECCD
MKQISILKVAITIAALAYSFCACNEHKKAIIIAEIDGQAISENELNTLIKQELFDELTRIYEIKKKALEQLINVKLIQAIANEKQMSYQQFIDYYTENKMKNCGIDSLLKQYKISTILQLRDTNMYTVPTHSPTAEFPRYYQLKGAIMSELLDSLKKGKDIKQYLYPPKSPSIDLSKLHTYYRGNQKSDVTFITISDFDCESCIHSHRLYDSIYNKYKDRVKFGYIHYSAMPTLGQIASDAADNQGKFWSFHDSLYVHKGYIDSSAIFNIAKSIGLNIDQFKKDIKRQDRKSKIESTINQLVLNGVYATPTIMINGRLIVDSNSKKEICHLIDEELAK